MPIDIARTRRASSLVFGNEKTVEVVLALAAASGGLARTTDIVDATGIPNGMVRPVLLRLQEARLLQPLGRRGGSRGEQFYEVQSQSPAWAPLCNLASAIAVFKSDDADARTSGRRPDDG